MTDHVPLRTCIVCRRRASKAELFRFVSDEAGSLLYDAKNNKPGRGFYLCRTGGCLERYIRVPRKYSTRFGLRGIAAESINRLEKYV